ncbi:hypothetical protein HETIRDRAFT_426030 [Heterobasidion irregulare TC 32-1]|uniref:Uncharacterized protein n=1 Tax=Heterobasidion irregulare (strain TC 32-1) TaxID=747525 RepID=W4KII4_HETIT|nr:uncharacterized protein HETIRDRAFT_426030 [Heterobasidion irregulare TC 32-1]ETW84856.1 hypothetical protein HETIRDRAFT_426030 [Heterobasidion irregulare TC 32-1]
MKCPDAPKILGGKALIKSSRPGTALARGIRQEDRDGWTKTDGCVEDILRLGLKRYCKRAPIMWGKSGNRFVCTMQKFRLAPAPRAVYLEGLKRAESSDQPLILSSPVNLPTAQNSSQHPKQAVFRNINGWPTWTQEELSTPGAGPSRSRSNDDARIAHSREGLHVPQSGAGYTSPNYARMRLEWREAGSQFPVVSAHPAPSFVTPPFPFPAHIAVAPHTERAAQSHSSGITVPPPHPPHFPPRSTGKLDVD